MALYSSEARQKHDLKGEIIVKKKKRHIGLHPLEKNILELLETGFRSPKRRGFDAHLFDNIPRPFSCDAGPNIYTRLSSGRIPDGGQIITDANILESSCLGCSWETAERSYRKCLA